MLIALAALVAALFLAGLVQDVVYFLQGHESLTARVYFRVYAWRVRKRAIRIPCASVRVRAPGWE